MPTRRRPRFTERDVKRALRAAANTGLIVTSVEIKPDGGIAMMLAGSKPSVTKLNENASAIPVLQGGVSELR